MDKIVFITGASSGIGAGCARKFASQGASLILNARNVNKLSALKEELEKQYGTEIYLLPFDVRDRKAATSALESLPKEWQSIDILVNNAGINKDRMLHKMSVDDWNAVIAVNLTGVFNCMRAAVNYMREREYGRIINISSASYLNGNIGQANYAAAKAGVVALTKTCAKENGKKNITCNAIVPGFIDTEMTRGVPEKAWDIMVGKISMGRAGTPEDIGNMIAFLASDEASYITQGVFEVGGGMVL